MTTDSVTSHPPLEPVKSEPTPPLFQSQSLKLQLGPEVKLLPPDFELQAGEQVAITGPSGCGKSSFLHLLSGLLTPDQGRLHFQGEELTALSAAARDRLRASRMGLVHQSLHLLGHFSAEENIRIAMRFGGQADATRRLSIADQHTRAKDLLDRVGLSGMAHKRPAQLSIGEQQRVAVARALANRPAVLLADEPTGSLDPATARDVFDLIREQCESEACALILVSHDLALASELPKQIDAREFVQRGARA